jgi:MoaA/NifB/PqqE/SkfB family radical SAM enzyme
MNIHNLTRKEKVTERIRYMRSDFPFAYGISLGEYRCNRTCRMCPMYNLPPADSRYMTEKVMERACKEVADRSCNLEISAYGETFQHPTADDFRVLPRKLCTEAEVVVATNGSLLNR